LPFADRPFKREKIETAGEGVLSLDRVKVFYRRSPLIQGLIVAAVDF
jgi:hypothetical protein